MNEVPPQDAQASCIMQPEWVSFGTRRPERKVARKTARETRTMRFPSPQKTNAVLHHANREEYVSTRLSLQSLPAKPSSSRLDSTQTQDSRICVHNVSILARSRLPASADLTGLRTAS